ncbi:MAG: M13 family metallopeptidase [Bacteroidales bacterium]|nr:M13 family metallopeptidase [Bacteroidales bacterium]
MKAKYSIIIIFAVLMTSCGKKNVQSSGIDITNIDTTVTPQNDFYQYACGGWMAKNPLTPEYARFGSFDKLGENNREQVKALVEEIAAKDEKVQGSVEQKIGDLYNLAMDSTRLNAEGNAPVMNTLDKIASIKDKAQLSVLMADLFMRGEGNMFYVYSAPDPKNSSMNLLQMYQSGFAMGEREYYLDNDETTQNIRSKYVAYMTKMFELFGFTPEQSEADAATVLRMETRLATAAYDNVTLRDVQLNYNKKTLDELQVLVPQISWNEFFGGLCLDIKEVSVGQIPHLQEVGKMIEEESLENIITYLQWQTINGASSVLSDDIYAVSFDFYGRTMSGREEPSPRWKRAVSTVNGVLGEAVGEMYVAKYFPPEAKDRMVQLVSNLQKSLGERIHDLEWMSDSTKVKAQEKLDAFYVKIGYPDKWRDYSALNIDMADSYYANLVKASVFENEYNFGFVGKPVDRDKWQMTPQTVNAYYDPSINEICFPAGILQYPFFDMNADDAFNYGAIGVVIGHEMTHGFDDQGSQFDKDGNLNNWWTPEDKEKFDARTKVLADYFDSIEVAPGVHANGRFTLGENIADHGGLQVSYQAFKNATKDAPLATVDGFTPEQRFFLAYATVWAGNIRPEEILVRTKSDPHSLGRWRVNGALPHINAWYDAYQVDETSPMYVKPENRASIW